MILNRLEAWMDGVALTSISPVIFIEEISTAPAGVQITSAELAGRNGVRQLNTRRSQPSVTITLRILEGNRVARQAIYQQVVSWASGSRLRISDRPEQELRCVCTAMPALSNVMKWIEPVSITLTGLEHAFWEDRVVSTLTLSGTSGSGNLYVPGNGGEVCGEVVATPASGTLNTLTLTVGQTSMSFSSLGATGGSPFKISYDERLLQSIKVGNSSAMSKRSGASADDLLGVCGKINTISMTANVSTSVVFRFRGAWT